MSQPAASSHLCSAEVGGIARISPLGSHVGCRSGAPYEAAFSPNWRLIRKSAKMLRCLEIAGPSDSENTWRAKL